MMFPYKGVLSKLGAPLALVLLFLATATASAQTLLTSPNVTAGSSQNIAAQLNAGAGETAIDSGAKPKPLAAVEVKPEPVEAAAAKENLEPAKNTESAKNTEPATAAKPLPPAQCKRNISADVVAMPQPIMLNRLGAAIPDGLIFALRSDTNLPGQTTLRAGKRPRPLVLRANVGDCLTIAFQNLIPANTFSSTTLPGSSTGTTEVSLHVQG